MVRALLLFVCAALVGCHDLRGVMSSYGFTELTPPSTLFAPGTLVWVRRDVPFAAGVVCTQAASLGRAFRSIEVPTASRDVERSLGGQFSLGDQAMRAIRADLHLRAVSRVTVAFSNASVLTLSDADLLEALPYRDPKCRQAVEARRAAGYEVTMIASAIRADVVYRVALRQDLNLDARAEHKVLAALAPKLGLESAPGGSDSALTGTGLFWGIVDDSYLALLGLDPPLGASPEPGVRITVPGEALARQMQPPDAP